MQHKTRAERLEVALVKRVQHVVEQYYFNLRRFPQLLREERRATHPVLYYTLPEFRSTVYDQWVQNSGPSGPALPEHALPPVHWKRLVGQDVATMYPPVSDPPSPLFKFPPVARRARPL